MHNTKHINTFGKRTPIPAILHQITRPTSRDLPNQLVSNFGPAKQNFYLVRRPSSLIHTNRPHLLSIIPLHLIATRQIVVRHRHRRRKAMVITTRTITTIANGFQRRIERSRPMAYDVSLTSPSTARTLSFFFFGGICYGFLH